MTSKTRATKALEVILRYERAKQLKAGLTKRIGREMVLCPIAVEIDEDRVKSYFSNHLDPRLDEKGNPKTHLWHALHDKNEVDCYGEGVQLIPLETEEQLELVRDCPHCLDAFTAIIQRKAAKKEIGIATRAIRSLARAELLERHRESERGVR